jgi:hypothetical protein
MRVVLSLGLVVGSLAAGWWLRRRGRLSEPQSYRLLGFVATRLSPLVLWLSFWQMPLRSREPWLLPLLGVAISVASLAPAWLVARQGGLSRPQQGGILTCAVFSNVGFVGGLLAFAVFGEAGYALCMLYFMLFGVCFYSLGFGLARRYGVGGPSGRRPGLFEDELRLYPLLGMLAGIGCSMLGPVRPMVLGWVNRVLIPVDTAMALTAIGSQLTFESPRPWWRACAAMCAIKFLYCPAVAWVLATWLGLSGLTRTVVLIEASTPVALSPLMLPLLFGLDRRLTNALWLVTTVVAVPWLWLILPLLEHL